MFEILVKGGIIMVPIVLASVIALTISLERAWALRSDRVAPKNLVAQVWNWLKKGELSNDKIKSLRESSPLGEILAAGLVNHHHGREIMKESIEDVGRQVAHRLERYLNALGSIATASPLMGLLGTVLGMMDSFTVISAQVGNPNIADLTRGISEALITTASGLFVAIPALFLFRFFQRRVDDHVASMELEALKLVEIFHGEREPVSGDKPVATKASKGKAA